MQLVVILLFMLILPVLSTAWDVVNGRALIEVIGGWFVFWGVGWRLLAAGVHQLARPAFTARDIFGINDPGAAKLVKEIGFGNIALGIASIVSLLYPEWVPALALAGMIFYALAGIQHIFNKPESRAEIVAMISDLWLAGILIVYLVWYFLR